MAYSKNKLEIHSFLAALYEKYQGKGFIQFKNTPEVKGTQYLEPVIEAIEGKKVLRISYLPFYEDKPYYNEIHPYLLKEHGFRWYLIAWNDFKKQLRTYALDRIRDIQELKGTAFREAEFDSVEYFRYTLGVISPPGAPPLVKLAVQKTQAQYLITQPWHDSQNIYSEDEQQVVFSFRVHPTYEFKTLVLGLGNDAEVLEPESLRREFKEELTRMAGKYK